MIKKYTMKSGETRYLFQTYLGVDPLTGKERRTTRRGFKTIKEAKQAERNLLLNVEEYGLPSNNLNNLTFKEVASLWFESYQTTVKPTTAKNLKIKLDTIIKHHIHDLKIDKMTVVFCQKITIDLSKQYILYQNYLSIINRVLKYAVSMDILKSNPLDKVIRPKSKQPRKKDNHYTKEELSEFLKFAKEYSDAFHVFYHTIAYTGLRRGEALALKWKEIDLDNKTITVNHTAVILDGKQVLQSPKTKASKRIIQIDDNTIKILKSWRLQQKKDFLKAGKVYLHDENFVFTNHAQEWTRLKTINNALKYFYNHHPELKEITVHGFRHTHASLLFEAGVEAKAISDRLGHTNIQTTLNLYTHLNDTQRINTVNQFMDFMAL
jgi:phage integrase family protein|nr:MAG TPA: RECOMBINASE CRE [Caudoviricetes sp.]